MLYVDEETNVIKLTRGDTARFSLTVNNAATGSEYEVQPDDTIRFTVKKTEKDSEYLFQKVINGGLNIHIQPTDTNSLAFGKYVYDVELTTASGDVYTVIPPTLFQVLKEVTY